VEGEGAIHQYFPKSSAIDVRSWDLQQSVA
jgi:hypothetical protein